MQSTQETYSMGRVNRMEFRDACAGRICRALLAGVPAIRIARERGIPMHWVKAELQKLKSGGAERIQPHRFRLD